MINAELTLYEEGLAELPENWAEEFVQKMKSPDIWLGYDAALDAGYIWFTDDRSNAVHVPIVDDIEIVINDDTGESIGMVIYRLRAMAERALPITERILILSGKKHPPTAFRDIPMQPLRELEKKASGRELIRTVFRNTASTQPSFAD